MAESDSTGSSPCCSAILVSNRLLSQESRALFEVNQASRQRCPCDWIGKHKWNGNLFQDPVFIIRNKCPFQRNILLMTGHHPFHRLRLIAPSTGHFCKESACARVIGMKCVQSILVYIYSEWCYLAEC